MRRRLNFFLIVLFLLFLLTGWQIQAFLPGDPARAWSMAALCFAAMIPWQFAFRMGGLKVGSKALFVAAWIGNVTLGIWGTFVMLCVPFNLIYLVAWTMGLTLPLQYSLFGEWVLWTALGIGVVGWLQTVMGPRLTRVNVPIANLPAELVGLTIAQISDLHVGPTIGRRYVTRVVRRVKALEPHLIAFTGDFGDGPAPLLKPDWLPLAELSAPLGKFYVNGNHEYYWGGEPWEAAARETGFETLLNENRIVTHQGHAITVGGVADPAARHFTKEGPNCKRALAGGEKSALKILLAHQPENCEEAAQAGFDLQLSGHTHGGQFFPFIFFMPFAHRYFKGLNRHGKMWVYVCVGTGYWGPPNRFAVPSEISLLTLQRANG